MILPMTKPLALLGTILGVSLSVAAGTETKSLAFAEVQAAAAKIDQLLETSLKQNDATPLPIVSDELFVRRAFVSIVGRIPTAAEAASFLDDPSTEKRSVLIEQLVQSPGYDSSAFNYFADLLRLQTSHEQYGLGWHVWLRESLAEDKPWNKLVGEMLAAEGHAVDNPAVGYYLRDRGMLLDNVSNTVQVFLGHQIGCAQCHDHPFDKWTQMEYYELAAFSGGVRYDSQAARDAMRKIVALKKKEHPRIARALENGDRRTRSRAQRELVRRATGEVRYLFRDFRKNEITENGQQSLELPDDYQYEDAEPGEEVEPATLFGAKIEDVEPAERRRAFADWVTSPENPYFTKVIANRLWDRTFGHGLVDPVDDWNSRSTGSHPEVLAYLEKAMQGVGYRTRDFERILYHTKLFQREVSPIAATPGTAYHFAGPQLRRLSAEELYDSFTVLAFGNTDDNVNTALEEKWEEHQTQIRELLSLPAQELLAAGKDAREVEEMRREFQQKQRELRTALNEARKNDNKRELARLQRRQIALRRETRDQREEMSATMSMVMQRYPGRTARARLNMRASEHPTPFRPNHLVRQFGGSDRNTPEAANTHATIPQALTLLNGRIVQSVENSRSELFRKLTALAEPEARLEHLFLALYACRPSKTEEEQFLSLAQDPDDLATLARAMLTSKRYLFVQ